MAKATNIYEAQDREVIISAFSNPPIQGSLLNSKRGGMVSPNPPTKPDEGTDSTAPKNVAEKIDSFDDLNKAISKGLANINNNIDKQIGEIFGYEKIQSYLDELKGVAESLYKYGTAESGIEADISNGFLKNVKVANTFVTMFDDGKFDAKDLATILADCIPCKDRIQLALGLNPLDGFKLALTAVIDNIINFIDYLNQLLFGPKSAQILADLCSLLKFLSFMCLPDLYSIIVMLGQLIAKYTLDFKNWKVSFQAIIGQITGPSLQPLMAYIDQFAQLIIAPMECIANALDAQIQKLDVAVAYSQSFGEENTDPVFALGTPMSGALNVLKKHMNDGLNFVRGYVDYLNAQIADILKIELEGNVTSFDLLKRIQDITMLIGVVQAVIQLLFLDGELKCGPDSPAEGPTDDDIARWVTEVSEGNKDMRLAIGKDGNMSIMTKNPALPKTNALLASANRTTFDYDQSTIATTDAPTTSNGVQSTVEHKTQIRSCLYTVTDKDLDQVKNYLSNFQTSTIG